jgi:hypothetical protein
MVLPYSVWILSQVSGEHTQLYMTSVHQVSHYLLLPMMTYAGAFSPGKDRAPWRLNIASLRVSLELPVFLLKQFLCTCPLGSQVPPFVWALDEFFWSIAWTCGFLAMTYNGSCNSFWYGAFMCANAPCVWLNRVWLFLKWSLSLKSMK